MMKFNKSIVVVCMLLMASVLVGQGGKYKYKRSINGVADTWHAIPLPQDVLNKTIAEKGDIRIVGYDSSGKESKVPYLIRSQEEQIIVESEFVNVFNESTIDSLFVYTTEESSLGKINEIHLDIGNSNFDGRIKLEGKDGDNWFTILEDYRIFSFSKPSGSYNYTTLEIPQSEYKLYRISISNITDPILNNVSVKQKTIKAGKYYNSNASIQLTEDSKGSKTSKYKIELDAPSRISEFTFDVKGEYDYYRRLELSTIVDSVKSKSGWQMIKKSIYNGALNSYEDGKVSFNEVIAKSIEMTIYNLDDEPLQIVSAKARTPQYHLEARFLTEADFYLIYGNPYANKPQYDLTQFEDNIPENLISLELGDPVTFESMGEVNNFFIPTYALWAIMALIIAVIGWFTIKMLSSETITEE